MKVKDVLVRNVPVDVITTLRERARAILEQSKEVHPALAQLAGGNASGQVALLMALVDTAAAWKESESEGLTPEEKRSLASPAPARRQ